VSEELPTYTCYTLFNIPDKGDRNIIRNWNTVVQVASLRCQPYITKFPQFVETDLERFNFGSSYTGIAKVWSFEFSVDHSEIFAVDEDPIANLKSDSNLVPMKDYNNIIIGPRCLISYGEQCNIYYVFNNKN